MRRCLTVLLLTQLISTGASAHDFWLEPEKFTSDAPGHADITAKVGHGADVGEWPAEPGRVTALRLIGADGVADVQQVLADRSSQGRFTVPLREPGVYILALESTGAVSDLPAKEFNSYILEEGLTPIKQHRAELKLTRKAGREVYSRRGKSILLAGKLPGAEDEAHALSPVGLTLEITPLVLPARLQPGADLPVEVRYRGRPLPGATLHLVRLGAEAGDVGRAVTGDQGRAYLPFPGEGSWMLQTVWSSPLAGDVRGDYDTVFSSLSFSIGAPVP